MDVTEGCREFEPIRTARDHLFDDIGTKPLVIEFLCRMDSPDILRAKPYFVTDIIFWGFALVGIVESGHVALTSAAHASSIAWAILDAKLSKDSS